MDHEALKFEAKAEYGPFHSELLHLGPCVDSEWTDAGTTLNDKPGLASSAINRSPV